MSTETKAVPIGAEEYILICKKVADKLRGAVGLEKDATIQGFISITDTVYSKLHKLTPSECTTDATVVEEAVIVNDGPPASASETTET